MSRVIPPDVALWATERLRGELAGQYPGLQVDIRVPAGYRGDWPLIVIRDDGGGQEGPLLFDRSLGVTVHYGPIDDPYPARQLAAAVYASLTDTSIPYEAGPVASITSDGCNGPYPVTGQDLDAAWYMTVEYQAVGTIQTQQGANNG